MDKCKGLFYESKEYPPERFVKRLSSTSRCPIYFLQNTVWQISFVITGHHVRQNVALRRFLCTGILLTC